MPWSVLRNRPFEYADIDCGLRRTNKLLLLSGSVYTVAAAVTCDPPVSVARSRSKSCHVLPPSRLLNTPQVLSIDSAVQFVEGETA